VPFKVFISYAKEDQEKALHYHDLLLREGVEPWLDIKHLLPGQNWETEIQRAFAGANLVVLLLSKISVNKRGFVQREANEAIERLRYKQPTDIYVIPLLLEPCEVPSHIAGRLQYVDLKMPGAWDQVKASIRLAAEQQSIELEQGVLIGPFRVTSNKLRDQWEAQPGHDIEIDYPRFESSTAPLMASELSPFFAGRAVQSLIQSRQKPWDQDPKLYDSNFGSTATNGRWEGFGIAHATERLVSVTFDIGWYGAGAAHPNSHFETYNFAFVDRLFLLELADFFDDVPKAIQKISEICQHALAKEYWERTGEKPDSDQLKQFATGAGEDADNFTAFTVSEDRFTFLFAPYQVSAYALGSWSVDVSFYDLLNYLRPNGPHIFAAKASVKG
jgi:hypothetical protein